MSDLCPSARRGGRVVGLRPTGVRSNTRSSCHSPRMRGIYASDFPARLSVISGKMDTPPARGMTFVRGAHHA